MYRLVFLPPWRSFRTALSVCPVPLPSLLVLSHLPPGETERGPLGDHQSCRWSGQSWGVLHIHTCPSLASDCVLNRMAKRFTRGVNQFLANGFSKCGFCPDSPVKECLPKRNSSSAAVLGSGRCQCSSWLIKWTPAAPSVQLAEASLLPRVTWFPRDTLELWRLCELET